MNQTTKATLKTIGFIILAIAILLITPHIKAFYYAYLFKLIGEYLPLLP